MSDVLAPSLFDAMPADVTATFPGKSHAHDPETSHAAAVANAPRSGTQRERVLFAFVSAGDTGLTDFEAAQRCELVRPHVAGNRRKELERLGAVARTEERRPTDTGCLAVVWTLTDAGRDLAERCRREEAERAS